MTLQGLTHLTTLLIRFPFARASTPPNSPGPYFPADIDHATIEAFGHESTHFYQALTTNFLFSVTLEYFDATREALASIAHTTTDIRPGGFPELAGLFQRVMDRLWLDGRDSLKPIDLIEGAAVHATFHGLTSIVGEQYPDTALGFEDYLWRRFRDPSRAHYVRAYRTARSVLGDSTYDLLGKLCYLALCDDEDPPGAFAQIVASLRRSDPTELTRLSLTELAQCGGVRDIQQFLPMQASRFSGAHPVLGPYLEYLASSPESFDLLAFAAEPMRDALLRVRRVPTGDPTILRFREDLVPPLFVYSDGVATAMGLAKRLGLDYVQAVIHYTAMIGLVQRLTLGGPVETLCPHGACPHHSERLCWRYYAFPKQDYGRCSFPQRASQLLGREIATAGEGGGRR